MRAHLYHNCRIFGEFQLRLKIVILALKLHPIFHQYSFQDIEIHLGGTILTFVNLLDFNNCKNCKMQQDKAFFSETDILVFHSTCKW